MDPIANLVEPLHDLVFQHLTGRELMNLFAVSQDFNEAAKVSRNAMSKIKLNIRDFGREFPSKDQTLLLKSGRQYKYVDIRIATIIRMGREINFDRVILLLEKFSPTLEELHFCFLRELPDQNESQTGSALRFPKLKILSLGDWVSGEEAHKILSGTSEHLKEVALFGAEDLFDVPMPSIEGKLTSFRYNCNLRWNEQRQDNFEDFLMSVSSTLQILQINNCDPDLFEFILTKLPALKVLEVVHLNFEEAPAQVMNQTITTLSIKDSGSFTPDNTLKCMENLETVIVDEGELKAVLRQAIDIKKLKTVEVQLWCEKCPHATYRDLMQSDPTIPRGIEIISLCTANCNCLK